GVRSGGAAPAQVLTATAEPVRLQGVEDWQPLILGRADGRRDGHLAAIGAAFSSHDRRQAGGPWTAERRERPGGPRTADSGDRTRVAGPRGATHPGTGQAGRRGLAERRLGWLAEVSATCGGARTTSAEPTRCRANSRTRHGTARLPRGKPGRAAC